MRKALMNAALLGTLALGGAASAHGQEATEMFIPIGQSPGLSGKVTVIGTLDAIDAGKRTITIVDGGATWSAEITDRTEVWLDRSKLRLPNQKGTFADLKKGLPVEVKYEDAARRGMGPARWVKVQPTQ
jgi:hypothetical protein